MARAGAAAEGPIVTVVVDLAGLDREFRYLVPPDLCDRVRVGSILRVPLRGRRVRAWVIDGPRVDDTLDHSGLRSIIEFVSIGPSSDIVDVARFGAWRYAGWLRSFLKTASPERVIKSLPARYGSRTSTGTPAGVAVDAAIGSAVKTSLDKACAMLRVPPAMARRPIIEAIAASVTGDIVVLVPEHHDAQIVARQLERSGHSVALMPDQWADAASGGRVVVGTRSAVLAPVGSLGAMVVLDAHAEAYVSQRVPTWNAVVLAIERCARAGVPCILMSPCPTLEELAQSEVVAFSRHIERSGWPVVEVIDRRGDDPRTGLYAPVLASAIRKARSDDPTRPVVCVLNRIGRARLMACALCGELVRCEQCESALSQRARLSPDDADELFCPRCDLSRPMVCASCGSARLKTLRAGVGRVREELSALTGFDVEEVSSTTGDSGPIDTSVPVLVGTEAVLHRVRSASLVVFLDFDQHLLAPRFRAAEQSLALLARAGRLVGARTPDTDRRRSGRVAIQTRLVSHEVIVAAVSGDPLLLDAHEAPRRKMLRLPPNCAMATLSGEDVAALQAHLEQIAGLELLPVTSGTVVVRAADHDHLCDALASFDRADHKVRIEVDPLNV